MSGPDRGCTILELWVIVTDSSRLVVNIWEKTSRLWSSQLPMFTRMIEANVVALGSETPTPSLREVRSLFAWPSHARSLGYAVTVPRVHASSPRASAPPPSWGCLRARAARSCAGAPRGAGRSRGLWGSPERVLRPTSLPPDEGSRVSGPRVPSRVDSYRRTGWTPTYYDL